MNRQVIKKISGLTDKMDIEKIKTKRKAVRLLKSWKLKVAVVLLSLAILGGVCLMAFYQVSKFYDENKVIFQTPIIIKTQPMIKIEKRAKIQARNTAKLNDKVVEATPVPKTEFEIVNAQPHGQILWKIYLLETGRGSNDYCRKSGAGYGGFGVMSAGEVICYESFEKACERAEYWLAKMKPDVNLASALCQWNTGTPNLVNCAYYQSFISL